MQRTQNLDTRFFDSDEIRYKILRSMVDEFPEIRSLILLKTVVNESRRFHENKKFEERKNAELLIKKRFSNKSGKTPLWAKLILARIHSSSNQK